MDRLVTNGCSGKCCENFSFPYTLDELSNMYIAYKEGKTHWINRHGDIGNFSSDQDMQEMPYILDMLISLGFSEINDIGESYNSTWEGDEEITRTELKKRKPNGANRYTIENGVLKVQHFTCKHFDKEKRICTAYEKRPGFCKRYGEFCAHKCCNFNDKKKMNSQEFEKQYLQSPCEEEK